MKEINNKNPISLNTRIAFVVLCVLYVITIYTENRLGLQKHKITFVHNNNTEEMLIIECLTTKEAVIKQMALKNDNKNSLAYLYLFMF